MDNRTEPTYYVSTAFSGVGFLMPGEKLPDGAVFVASHQVDPEIREQGRDWMEGRL